MKTFTSVIEEIGNPFTDENSDVLILDITDIVDPAVVDSMNKLEEIGREQYKCTMQLLPDILSLRNSLSKTQ